MTLGPSHIVAAVVGSLLTNLAWVQSVDGRFFLTFAAIGGIIFLCILAQVEVKKR